VTYHLRSAAGHAIQEHHRVEAFRGLLLACGQAGDDLDVDRAGSLGPVLGEIMLQVLKS